MCVCRYLLSWGGCGMVVGCVWVVGGGGWVEEGGGGGGLRIISDAVIYPTAHGKD